MEEKEDNKKRRNRRTNYEVDRDIMAALKSLIEKVGFTNITLSAVAQKAKVEPQVIYNRFTDLNGLLDKYVDKSSYWLNDILANYIGDFNESNHEAFLAKFLNAIAIGLYKDKSMQQLLIWEIAENNPITSRSAMLREANVRVFSKFYENLFKDTDVNFNALTAIMISGIYYLILHKDCSTFCDIDFNTREGKEDLLQTIDKVYSWVFGELDQTNKVIEVARKLKNKGVDVETISECTGLTIDRISALA